MSNISFAGSTVPPLIDFSSGVQIIFSGNGPSTITVNTCNYFQFSNKVVYFEFNISLVTRVITSGTDVMMITLPITAANQFYNAIPCGQWQAQIDSKNWPTWMSLGAGTAAAPAFISLRGVGGVVSTLTTVTAAETSDGDNINGSFWYQGV